MDHRIPLQFHTVLTFEGMACHIEEVVGQGSNAIVYRGWYRDGLNQELCHHVLVKELFPLHPQKKIWRNAAQSLVIEPEAEELWNIHKESFEMGNEVHLRLLRDQPELMVMGANLNSFRYNGTLYSVLGYTGGRSLLTELNKNRVSLRRVAQRMIGLLNALEAFHQCGYLHLDISPDNVMMVGQEDQERMFLIDYNSARKIDGRGNHYLSCKTGYSAPEVSTGNLDAVDFSSDLYSVAAVFFRCIMDRSLSLQETLSSKTPDGQDSALLVDMPQTVCKMVSTILRKGLHTLPGRRYRSIGQMRQAFQELLDRIDCVGVTHWSLWENGKRSVEELIRINPSLKYLHDARNLYPIRIGQESGISLEGYLDKLLSPEGKSGLILAQGGMGKTTLLLHTAALRGKRYSPGAPAVFYISLNGWQPGDTHFIRRQILMRLRFKREENTFEMAMHALQQLLEQPLKTKAGEIPAVLLLLDGLNEVQGALPPLVQEINALNRLPGVRILAASRSELPELELEPTSLIPLHMEDIETALGRNGLLLPSKPDVLQLLRTPLILSIYIQASQRHQQLDVQTEEDLMKAYLESLLEKETSHLTEDAPLRWQTDVALNYVLLMIAAEIRRTGQPLTEQQMLKVVEKCWKILHSRRMWKKFPEWIQRSEWSVRRKEIFADAATPEEWYGTVIHQLLWQRLGMLVRNEEKCYRLFHQSVGEYLAERAGLIQRRMSSPRLVMGTVFGTVILSVLIPAVLLAASYLQGEKVVFYEEKSAQTVIEQVSLCYGIHGSLTKQMQDLLQLLPADDPGSFRMWYRSCEDAVFRDTLLTENGAYYTAQIDRLCQSGDQVPWSELPFAGEAAKTLISEATARLELYRQYLPLLKAWAESERAQKHCPDFPDRFGDLLSADDRMMSKLYYQSCYPHLEAGDDTWEWSIKEIVSEVPAYQTEPTENLESLQTAQREAMEAFANVASTVAKLCAEQLDKENK